MARGAALLWITALGCGVQERDRHNGQRQPADEHANTGIEPRDAAPYDDANTAAPGVPDAARQPTEPTTTDVGSDASLDAGRDGAAPDDDGGTPRDADVKPLCTPRTAHALRPEILLSHDAGPNDPVVTGSIRAVQLEPGGGPALLVAEPFSHQVTLLEDCAPGGCGQQRVLSDLGQPVRAYASDLDRDGRRDLVVADVGSLYATTERVGRVLVLDRKDDGGFAPRVVLDGVGRVSCAEPGDIDGDGDDDIAVCEFGAVDGAFSWLEQQPGGAFLRHELARGSGATDAHVVDLDGDGLHDLVVAMSQDFQQVRAYRGLGEGAFREQTLWQASEDFGLVGLEVADIDHDDDLDLVVAGGDYFDERYDVRQHGVWLLENDGHGEFEARKLASLVGAEVTRTVDFDGDCDLDVVVASMRVQGLIEQQLIDEGGLWWLENDGALNFSARPLGAYPSHLIALEVLPRDHGYALFLGSFVGSAPTQADARLVALWPR
jgi:FG-GAP-like repeat